MKPTCETCRNFHQEPLDEDEIESARGVCQLFPHCDPVGSDLPRGCFLRDLRPSQSKVFQPMTPRRCRRPHSRQGRTAQTRALQRLRRGGNEPSHTKNIMVYWRICHRRERIQAERRAYHRSRMLQIRIDNHLKYLGTLK